MKLRLFFRRPVLPIYLASLTFSVLVILALLVGGWTAYPKALSQFRNPILISLGVFFVVFGFQFARYGKPVFGAILSDLRDQIDYGLLRTLILTVYALAFYKATLLDYWSFSISALDASIYDYATMNTLRGDFMRSVNGAKHFGIHATPILFLLMPLHALFNSPLFFIFLQPTILWFGALLFDRCAKNRGVTSGWRCALLFGYFNTVWVALTLHYGFHIEIFYPVCFFLIDIAISSKQAKAKVLFWVSVVLFLTIKEDAPFHLAALLAVYFFLKRISFSRAALGTLLGLGVAVYYLKVLIPHHAGSDNYTFIGSAAGAGRTLGEAVQYLFSHPIYFLERYFTGGWWKLVLPSLGVLLFSPFYWIASLPLLGLYSIAGDSQMFHLTIYYSVPLLGVFYLGIVEGLSASLRKSRVLAVIALISVCTVGSGYLVFRRADYSVWLATHRHLGGIPAGARICSLASLVPQLPYGKVHLIDLPCLHESEFAVVGKAEADLSIFPHSALEMDVLRKELKDWSPVPGSATSRVEIYRRP